jgi:hypothetical protein
MNASYTLSWGKGNAEGPVNSDTDFADTGRTENFDDPWVNLNGYGYLPTIVGMVKLRGSYAITDDWMIGATLDAQSGGPVTGFGVGILTTARSITATTSALKIAAPPILPIALYAFQRGAYGRCHLRAGCQHHLEQAIPGCWLEGEVAVYNLTNQQKKLSVNQGETGVGRSGMSSCGRPASSRRATRNWWCR